MGFSQTSVPVGEAHVLGCSGPGLRGLNLLAVPQAARSPCT